MKIFRKLPAELRSSYESVTYLLAFRRVVGTASVFVAAIVDDRKILEITLLLADLTKFKRLGIYSIQLPYPLVLNI